MRPVTGAVHGPATAPRTLQLSGSLSLLPALCPRVTALGELLTRMHGHPPPTYTYTHLPHTVTHTPHNHSHSHTHTHTYTSHTYTPHTQSHTHSHIHAPPLHSHTHTYIHTPPTVTHTVTHTHIYIHTPPTQSHRHTHTHPPPHWHFSPKHKTLPSPIGRSHRGKESVRQDNYQGYKTNFYLKDRGRKLGKDC